METIDEREMQKTTKEKQTKAERSDGNRSYSERVRAKWFCCEFKLGFLLLICKPSLIFKSNLELALSIILKQRELYKSKHVSEECRSLCFKIIDKANSKFDLKIKEALHISWRKPNLNAQQNHLALTLSL